MLSRPNWYVLSIKKCLPSYEQHTVIYGDGEKIDKHLTAMTLRTDWGAAPAQLGEMFYEGVFRSKYNSLEKLHLVTAIFS